MYQFIDNGRLLELKQAYLTSSKDEGQQEAMFEWENTLQDGLEQC